MVKAVLPLNLMDIKSGAHSIMNSYQNAKIEAHDLLLLKNASINMYYSSHIDAFAFSMFK